MNITLLIGQILFGGYFVISGYNHLKNLGAITGYAASKGVPSPKVAVAGSGLLILLGGAAVLLDLYAKQGLAMIAVFLLFVTPMMHAYWKEKDANARMADHIQFMKNMGLLGATLMLWSSM